MRLGNARCALHWNWRDEAKPRHEMETQLRENARDHEGLGTATGGESNFLR